MGKTEARILKEHYAWRGRKKLPDRIINAPELFTGLEFYFEAYVELSTCRSVSWSAGPIPWTAIRKYAEVWELDSEESSDLHYHIRSMDHAYLKRTEQKNPK